MDMPQQDDEGGGGGQQERPTQSPVTRREYVRKNVSGMSQQGFDQNMMQSLMAGGGEQQQAG